MSETQPSLGPEGPAELELSRYITWIKSAMICLQGVVREEMHFS